MKLIGKTTFLFLLLFQFNSLLSQVTGFEVVIQEDSLDIHALKFINDYSGQGYIGLLTKMKNGNMQIYSSDLYHISNTGDTLRINIAKLDTNILYNDIISVNYGEPGYLLAGTAYNTNSSDTNLFIILTRLDTNYNTIWEKYYTYDSYFLGYTNMMQMMDSSFLLCCTPSEMFLFKFSYNGDSLKYREYTGDSAGYIESITYNPDSTAVWLHTNWAFYNGGGFLNSCVEIDSQLNETRVYHYPEYYAQMGFTSKLLPNGNLLTGGTTEKYIAGQGWFDTYISAYELDTSFNILHENLLTNPDTISRGGDAVAIDYCDPSCIYLAGTFNLQYFNGSEPSWFYVAKLNDTLGLEFEKYIGGDYYYWLLSVVAAKDGGVLLTGMRSEVNAPLFHSSAYIIKLDSTGCVVNLPVNNKIQIHDVFVYPNPGNEYLQIRTALKNSIFYLFNLEGQKVITQPLNKHVTVINTSSLSQGTYVYHIVKDNTAIESGKWIKK